MSSVENRGRKTKMEKTRENTALILAKLAESAREEAELWTVFRLTVAIPSLPIDGAALVDRIESIRD